MAWGFLYSLRGQPRSDDGFEKVIRLHFWSILLNKASIMAGFTVTLLLSRALTNICVDEVPDPHSRPTTVRQGNGNGGLLY